MKMGFQLKTVFLAILSTMPFYSGFAQNDMYANVNLQFRLDNPGARARGMGGAFVGLADDTTAIFANPAGLTQMLSSTLVGDISHSRLDNEIPFYGGEIRRVGLQDFEFDLETREFPEDTTSIPFLAYVRSSPRIKWGVFYAEQVNFQRKFDTAGVGIPPYQGPTNTVNNPLVFFNPSENSIDLKLRTLGFTAAGKLSDKLSVGITASYNELDYQANTTLRFPNLEALFPDINFNPRDLEVLRPLYGTPSGIIDVDGDDRQLGVFAGIFWAPSDRFGVGFSYQYQPEFEYDTITQSIDNSFQLQDQERGTGKFDVPDRYATGFSFKPTDLFVLSMEIARVRYSDLINPYTRFLDTANDPFNATQTVSDTTEYRAGGEYVFANLSTPLLLRAGYWFEPYHALKNTNLDTQTLFGFVDENGDFVQGFRPNAFLQRFEKDRNHVTFGFGVVVGKNLVIDAAADIAEDVALYNISGIYRF